MPGSNSLDFLTDKVEIFYAHVSPNPIILLLSHKPATLKGNRKLYGLRNNNLKILLPSQRFLKSA